MATNKLEFIPALTHGDEAVREYARQLLGIAGEDETPAFLAGLLASGTTAERQAAAQALGEIGGIQFSGELRRVLRNDGDPGVRAAAARALGRMDDPLAVGPLLQAMDGPDEEVRAGAVAALGQLDPLYLVSNFVLALYDASAGVRLEAARALMPSRSPAAVSALSACLADPDERVRVECARVLTAIGAAEAMPAFHAALQEPNLDELLVMAAEFLGNHGARQTEIDVIPALVGIVGRIDHPARPAAARALGRLGDLRAVPALTEALRHRFGDDFEPAAIEALGALGSPDAVASLARVMQITRAPQARKAAESLGRIGHPSAVPALVEVMTPARGGRLGERGSDLAEAAAEALGLIGDPSAIESLIEVLGGDPDVSMAAAVSLGHLGSVRAIPHLLARLRTAGSTSAIYYAEALKALGDTLAIDEQRRDLVDGAAPVARCRAAIAVGCLGSPEEGDEDLLIQALDDHEIVAQCAVEGLGLLDGDKTVEALLGVISCDDRNSVRGGAARELGAWPRESVTGALLALLDADSDRGVRTAAFLSLARMDAPEAVPYLRRAANTSGAVESHVAARWLERNPGDVGPVA